MGGGLVLHDGSGNNRAPAHRVFRRAGKLEEKNTAKRTLKPHRLDPATLHDSHAAEPACCPALPAFCRLLSLSFGAGYVC
jgi:hypothetical protein